MKQKSQTNNISTRSRFLYHPLFLTALLLLVLNDHYLKWIYANALTGKLSDIAGLILLPLLLAFLWPHRARWMPLLSALFFFWWKSPLSTGTIHWYNSWTLLPITRVVDYTDYWALLVLLPIHCFILRQQRIPNSDHSYRHLLINLSLILCTLCAFTATSPPHYYYYNVQFAELPFYGERYKVRHTRAEILHSWSELGYPIQTDTTLIDSLQQSGYYRFERISDADSSFFLIPALPLADDTVYQLQLSLFPLTDTRTMILLNGMQLPSPLPIDQTTEDIRKHYVKQLKKKLIRPL